MKEMDRKVKVTDYIMIAVIGVVALVSGVWTGLKQIPTYVKATYRSRRRMVTEIQKQRVDGKTASQRYVERFDN